MRRRRGPKPPDHIVAMLVAALPPAPVTQHQDVSPLALGARWAAAVGRAVVAIARAARRGVQGALGTLPPDPTGPVGPAPTPATWGEELTGAVRAASTPAGAVRAIEEAVFSEHTRQVATLARAMGADGYIWTTMRDARVRPLHVELEGTRQRWDAPPLAGLPNFHGHPGEAAGPCRCQAYPIRG